MTSRPGGIIDAHHHLWTRSRHPQPWIDPDTMAAIDADFELADLHAAVEGTDVRSTVLVQSSTSTAETADLLALAAGSELVAGVVGWVGLTNADAAVEISLLQEGFGGQSLVGIRHPVQGEPDPAFLDRPDVRRGIAAVAAAGMPYDVLVGPHQLPAAVRLARDLPEVAFVLDHLGKPPLHSGDLEAWTHDLRALAAQPNVVAKLSGLVTEAGAQWTVGDLRPAVDAALDVFGPERLMFGSDWPVSLLATTYADWLEMLKDLLGGALDEHIWHATAVRTYHLEETAT